MTTLIERIEWILKTRKISQRELGKRANLKNPNHVGTIMSRLRNRPGADIESETLAALARGGGVDVQWLIDGKGSPDGSTPKAVHPNLAKTLEKLSAERRISQHAASVLLAMGERSPFDLEPEIWALAALDLERRLHSKR